MRKITITLVLIISITTYIFAQDHQPEYTSYESSGTTDMVNLLTGDFVYNMPLIHVPGPEKGFDLPLSYHGGIRYDQKASWVGLGWSVNCGAISRNVSKYPDDFSGEVINSNLENPGITAVSRNWTVFSDVYHSEKGYGYQLMVGGLKASWGSAIDDAVSLIGVEYDFDGDNSGLSLDAEEFVIGIIQVAATLVDYGIVSNTVISTVVGILDAVSTAYTTVKGIDQLSSTFSNYSGMQGLWKETTKYSWFDRECLLKTTQNCFLKSDIDEYAYGTLYLGNLTPQETWADVHWINGDTQQTLMSPNAYDNRTTKKNYVHDYYLYVDNDTEYQWSMNPVNIAYDQYSVMGTGISGSIYPYRLDIGSVSTNNYNDRGNFYKFCTSTFTNYKVNFKYKGDIANNYYNHTGEGYGVDVNEEDLLDQYGITFVDAYDWKVVIHDDVLLYENDKVEADREGLYSGDGTTPNYYKKRLAAGRRVEWFNNKEIKDGAAFNHSNFMDFLPADESITFRNQYGDGVLDNGIGGYCITREDGVTYHYALPIYTHYTYNETESDLENVQYNTISKYKNNNPYAINWLLTAITGPDFIDRNLNNVVDEGDWGYWVKFTYTEIENSMFRTPYEDFIYSSDGTQWSFNVSRKEMFYLKTIETPSHVAFFDKSYRDDGMSICISGALSSLRLDNILLFSKEDYQYITTNFPDISYLEKRENDYSAISEALKSCIRDRQIKKIHFEYDYSLCNGDPTNFGDGGRLTLNSVGFYGKNNNKLLPDFNFFYGDNPDWNKDNWDGWGMYKPNGSNSAREATSYGNEWSLNKIATPNGGIIEVSLERDKYANVAGYSISEKFGGDIRVKEISVDDGINPKVSNKYIYTYNGLEGSLTSGVCSIEPEYDKTESCPLYDIKKKTSLYNYPRTPVLYEKVTVLKNKIDNEYLTKTEFEFTMPSGNMIECYSKDDFIPDGKLDVWPFKVANYLIKDKTNQIGSLKSMKSYYNNYLKQKITYNYTNQLPNNQGIFTEGTVFAELCGLSEIEIATIRIFRTTTIKYPNALDNIVFENGDKKTTVKNKEFDFETGLVLEKEYTNEPGDDYIVSSMPAYKVYPEMGLKAKDHENRNMLSQNFAQITYLKENDNLKVKQATVQTWDNDWDYRVYNTDLQGVREEGFDHAYRLKSQYVWDGDVNSDGTYSTTGFSDFNTLEKLKDNLNTIIDDPDGQWKNMNTIEKYNIYSFPVQVKDINGNNSCLIPDIYNKHIIASASNTTYNAFGFTSFENKIDNYFDSEFYTNTSNGIEHSDEEKHTGDYSLKILNGGQITKTFSFPDEYFDKNFAYKINLWIKPLVATEDFVVQTYFSFSGTLGNHNDNISFSKANTKKFGEWYYVEAITTKLTEIIDIGEFDGLTIYVFNYSSTVIYMDDLRLQPVNSPMESYVFKKGTGELMAVLDNNNIATKYEYDDAGKLKAVFKETPNGFKKVSEHNYGYANGLIISPNYLGFPGDYLGVTQTIYVTSIENWTVSKDADWVTVTPTSGSNNASITVSINEYNNSPDDRTATIAITGEGITKTVSIKQLSNAP